LRGTWRRMRRQVGARMRAPDTSRMRLVFWTVHAPSGGAAHAPLRDVPHAARRACERMRSQAGTRMRVPEWGRMRPH